MKRMDGIFSPPPTEVASYAVEYVPLSPIVPKYPPKLGECALTRDFSANRTPSLSVLVWNIERGYRLQTVIDELLAANADVVLLQEVDMGCRRSFSNDTGAEIARALGMRMAFATEYVNVNNEGRTESGDLGGVEGVAILTRYAIVDQRTIALPKVGHVDANRTVSPLALRATVDTPCGNVVFYSTHLNCWASRSERMTQFAPVIEDAVRTMTGTSCPVVVGGDLNTHNHGLTRLFNRLSGGERLAGLGQKESQWWDDTVKSSLQKLGCHEASRCGLIDPFDKRDDSHNMWFKVGPLTVWGGKLDWLLYSLFFEVEDARTSQCGRGSDHPYLFARLSARAAGT